MMNLRVKDVSLLFGNDLVRNVVVVMNAYL